MSPVEILSTVKQEAPLFNQLDAHSLNAGIPVLAKDEGNLFQQRAVHLIDKTKPLESDHFTKNPIFSLRFDKNEKGTWDNASAFVEIAGFDDNLFKVLQKPQTVSMRLLEVGEAVADFSGLNQMVEISFNVSGSEINLKRILLPSNYEPPVELINEPIVYQGTKMPDVFVDAWNKLQVGDYDQAWDLKVREQLLGNDRNMSKGIVYQMINGEKWVEWNGALIWAGLLSDRHDIDRFLTEEQALASLKPEEFLAAKFSHGSGGAISAATVGEQIDMPQVIGDVQMMGPDGKIYQAAVEGPADQIDRLMNDLVNQMRQEHGLVVPESQPFNFLSQINQLPLLPIETYPMKEWVITDTIDYQENISQQDILVATKPKPQSNFSAVVFTAETISYSLNLPVEEVAELALPTENIVYPEGSSNWLVTDFTADRVKAPDEPSWPPKPEDDNDGSSPQPQLPKSGGGGDLVRQIIDAKPQRTVVLEESISVEKFTVKKEDKAIDNTNDGYRGLKAPMFNKNSTTSFDKLTVRDQGKVTSNTSNGPRDLKASILDEISTKSLDQSRLKQESTKPQALQSLTTRKAQLQSESVTPEHPWWQMSLEGIDKIVPERSPKQLMVELNWNLTVPALNLKNELGNSAERAFEQGKWLEFDYLNKLAEIISSTLLAIVNTIKPQFIEPLPIIPALNERGRGSGQLAKAILTQNNRAGKTIDIF